jgi:hypothetical protein
MLRRLTFWLGSTALAALLALVAADTRADDGANTRGPSVVSVVETGGPWPGMLADRGYPVGVPRRPVYYDPLHPVACPWRPNKLIYSYPIWGCGPAPREQGGRAWRSPPAAQQSEAQRRASGGAAP